MENNDINDTSETYYDDLVNLQVYDKDKNPLDYTKFRLKSLINKSYSSKTIKSLIELLKNYESRKVAVGWKNGEPVYIELNNK